MKRSNKQTICLRRFVRIFKGILSLVLLVLEIIKRILDFMG
jgi:hypothetical protein